MIVLEKRSNSKGYFNIKIDNVPLLGAWAYKTSLQPNVPFQFSANHAEPSRRLANETLENFVPFEAINLNDLFNWMIPGHSIIISQNYDEDDNLNGLDIAFFFSPKLHEWKEDFTFSEYCRVFELHVQHGIEVEFKVYLEDSPRLEVKIIVDSEYLLSYPLKNIITPLEELLQRIHKDTIREIEAGLRTNSVRTSFVFPELNRIHCEQYLLYFAQFLRDLGIESQSTLKEQSGRVLFSITPLDDVDALDKIRKALSIYLNLPSSPVMYGEGFEANRLQQQIENLQHSQRMTLRELQLTEKLIYVQSETIREKNLTISQKNSTIEQQSIIIDKIISKSIMMDSLENKGEYEKIFEGLEVGESKWLIENLGIKVNPAKSLKTLSGKLLGKDKEIIALDLDKKNESE